MKKKNEGAVSTGDAQATDLTTVRKVYREINSKNQELSKLFHEQHICRLSDVKQIILQIEQAVIQHGCVESYWTFTILYLNDVQAQLTSVAELDSYDQSQNSPVESINIEFNYLTNNSRSGSPEAHKIELVLVSGLCLRLKAAESHSAKPEDMVTDNTITGFVRLGHCNYVIGIFLLNTIATWYEGLEKIEISKMLKALKGMQRWFATVFRTIFQTIFIVVIFFTSEKVFGANTPNHVLAFNILCLMLFFHFLTTTFFRAGMELERRFRRLSHTSALVLNLADKNMLEKFKKTRKKPVSRALVSHLTTFIMSVVASLLAVWLVS